MSDAARLAVLLGAMGALAVVETLAPLKAAPAARSRWPLNLSLTALTLTVNFAAGAGLVLVALATQRPWGEGPGAFLVSLVALDFSAYLAHVTMHQLPLLWRVHRIHHADAHVDVTTTFRQHPFETLWRTAFTAIGIAAVGASPAAVAVYRLLSGLNALLEHSNIRVPSAVDACVRFLLVTPHVHKVHHSARRPETDSNYGNIFVLFDRALGTYSGRTAPPERYGL